jgi:serine/threonine-protein kinase RsbT
MPASLTDDDVQVEIVPDSSGLIETAIRSRIDIVTARQRGRAEAHALGIDTANITSVAAAISEVARNIVEHAREGVIEMDVVTMGTRRGLRIVARDHGPGIRDVAQATQYGYSTGHGLGVGLPGAKWLMDGFEIRSTPGHGTTVTMIKWLPE